MSASSTINCRQHVKRKFKQHDTMKLDKQDLKIAQKTGWLFEYASICDYLKFNFVMLDYAEVSELQSEINTLSRCPNTYMSNLHDTDSANGVFVIRLNTEAKFYGCKHAQQKIGKMISKGRIPKIYVTCNAFNKLFIEQNADSKPIRKGRCHFCLKLGHRWRDCRIRNRNAPNWQYKANIPKREIKFSSLPSMDDWTL